MDISSSFPRAYASGMLVALGVVCAVSSPTTAQDVSESLRRQFRGGHRFIHNSVVPSPVIATFVRNSISIGEASDLDIPLFELDGEEIVALEGDLLFAGMDFEYQHAVKPWIAARARVRMVARLGNELGSLLSSGVTASTGFELGWLLKLVRSERMMLSASVDVSSNSTTIVDILGFVHDVIDSTEAQLVHHTPSMRGGGGLRFAYGVSALFGITAFASGGYGESIDRRADNEFFWKFGGSVDFDLSAGTGVPIGFVLGGVFDTFPEGGEDIAANVWNGMLRIEYTGRDDLGLGLAFIGERLSTRTLGSFGLSTVLVDLRYFF
jgi:hypothetical protein